MKLKKLFKGAGMLALLGVVGKIIGVFYRLPLTNILGAEGMGLYQMIFPLYSLILALVCGGLPAAISKTVSEANATGNIKGARRILLICLALTAAVGVIAAALLFAFRGGIASLQGNPKAALCYVAIAPAVALSGMIACYRGYFQGLMNLLPSGVSQLVEQIVKTGAGLWLAAATAGRGVEYGVFGALLGVSISELAALAYLAARYMLRRPKRTLPVAEAAADVAGEDLKGTVKRIYSSALPITLGSLVIPLSQAVDSFLVVNLLVYGGITTAQATSQFGILSGPVGSLINMPSVISVALAASLLPKVAYIRRKELDIGEATDKSLNAFLAIILPCAAVFAVAPYPILELLYSRGLSESELLIASDILRLESVNLPLIGLIQLTSAMMQGADRAGTPVINLLAGAVIKVVASAVFLPLIGIYGAAIGNIFCYAVTCSLDMIFAKKYLGPFINFRKQSKIVLCTGIFSLILAIYPLLGLFMRDIIAFAATLAVAGAVYLILLVKTKSIILSEMLR